MANKIKIFVGFLALIAVFSVLSFFNSFKGSSPIVKTGNTTRSSISFAIESDDDKDGLNNREESYWNTDLQNSDTDNDGFLDGEEVASGHDPLIPGPNDVLNNNNNLTTKLSNLTLSGLYEGSLTPNDPDYDKSLNDMALAVVDDAASNLSSKINPSKFKVVSSTKENQEIYLKEVSVLYTELINNFGEEVVNIQRYLELISSDGFKNKDLINFFQTMGASFQQISERGYSMSVPQNWIQNQTNFLHIVKNLELASNSIANGSDDPVKASAALNTIGESFESLSSLVDSFVAKTESAKLNNQFFKFLSQ